MQLTPTQKNIVIFLTIALGILIIVMAILTNLWYTAAISKMPMPDPTPTPTRPATAIGEEMDNYKTALAILKDNKSYLHKLLVVDFAAPLFKTLVGSAAAFILAMPLIQALAIRIKGNRVN